MRETSSGPSLSVDMLRDDQAKDGGRADPQGKQLEQSYVETTLRDGWEGNLELAKWKCN
jgi:hypothetical protein